MWCTHADMPYTITQLPVMYTWVQPYQTLALESTWTDQNSQPNRPRLCRQGNWGHRPPAYKFCKAAASHSRMKVCCLGTVSVAMSRQVLRRAGNAEIEQFHLHTKCRQSRLFHTPGLSCTHSFGTLSPIPVPSNFGLECSHRAAQGHCSCLCFVPNGRTVEGKFPLV